MAERGQSPTTTDAAARATSDELMAALRHLAETETLKRAVPTGSAEFLRLAVVADEAGKMVARWTAAQLEAASQAAQLVQQGQMTGLPIDQVAPRPLARILAQWRESEHRLNAAQPGSLDAQDAARDIERFRQEYQEASARVSAREGTSLRGS